MRGASAGALPAGGDLTPAILLAVINPGAVLLSAVAPALLGVLLAVKARGWVDPLMACVLVLIPALMNAAVDLLNDYHDYVRGNDGAEDADSPLAYRRVADPEPVRRLGLGLLCLAAVLGAFVVWKAGPGPAVIGLIGAGMVLAYSGGAMPLSHLPVGELAAGFTLGGLIPLGVFASLTGGLDPLILYQSIPMMLVVAQLMLVNNTCDIERDRAAGRRTLPILMGRAGAQRLADVVSLLWVAQLLHVTVTWFGKGLPVLAVGLLITFRGLFLTLRCDRTPRNRAATTGAVALAGLGVAVGYPLAVLVHILRS